MGLMSDVYIPISQQKSGIVLRKMITGDTESGCYVSISCDGFEELSIDATVIFSRDWLLPLDGNGEVINDANIRASGDIRTVVSDWEELVVQIDDFTPFAVKGLEDVLKPVSSLAEVLRFTVYNRWGQKTYEASGSSAAWDGTFKGQDAPIGSYVWTVEYLPKDAKAPRLEQGFVVLVR